MDDRFLIPANANRGRLIFGYFRTFDFVLFSIGLSISFILLVIYQNDLAEIWIAIGCSAPALICIFLVVPIPNYHNILVVLQEAYRFLTTNQVYEWKGWCYKNGKER